MGKKKGTWTLKMRNVLLASAGMLVLSAFAPAMAADMAARAPYVKAPPPVAFTNWTGFYIGGFGGYASENSGNPKMEGGFAGSTIGYNWRPATSCTAEADGGWADVDASISALGTTVKARPMRSAPCAAASASRSTRCCSTAPAVMPGSTTRSASRAGPTASQSSFHRLDWRRSRRSSRHSGRSGQYLYRSLGSENYFGVRSGDLNLHSVQFGVNYHFGGPILAKY